MNLYKYLRKPVLTPISIAAAYFFAGLREVGSGIYQTRIGSLDGIIENNLKPRENRGMNRRPIHSRLKIPRK